MAARAKGGVKGAGDAPKAPEAQRDRVVDYMSFPGPVFVTPDGGLKVARFACFEGAPETGYYYQALEPVGDDGHGLNLAFYTRWRPWRGVSGLPHYWQLRACELAPATHEKFPHLVTAAGANCIKNPEFAPLAAGPAAGAAKPEFSSLFTAGAIVGLIGLIFLLFGLVSAIWVALPSLFLAALGALMVGFGLWATARDDGA